jgi:antitoxin HicB
MKNKKYIGSSFDDYIEKEGLYHEVQASAIKKYLSALIQKKMEQDRLSKTKMAQLMSTSRTAVDRLLDPTNDSITLKTMESAARAIGKKIKFEFV